MKIFSTFTGIGGFEIGIQNAYRSTLGTLTQDTARELEERERLFAETGEDTNPSLGQFGERFTNFFNEGPLFVGYSEIDKYAISVYEKQFGGHNYGDITKINADELPDFDCLVGGFPCQAFSIAGKRGGFEDTRGTLFFDLARILRAKQPRLFVFENVKGLLSHDGGRTFSTIIATIDELGYDCQWQVINSKNHGVPQNRERIIIVGHLRGTPRPEVFPLGNADEKDTRIVGQDVAYTIDANYHKGTNTLAKSRRSIVQLNQPTHSNDRVYAQDGISPTLNTMQGGNRQPFIAAQRGRGNPPKQTLEPQTEDKTNSITSVAKDNLVVDMPRIRRLTPLECERLQAFPDDWTKYGITKNTQEGANDVDLSDNPIIPISDTQRYKMCGNAVTTNVIQAVFERILV